MKDLIPILSVIVGGLLAFLGSTLQQSISRKSERRRLIRERLEEIYLLSEQIENWGQTQVQEITRMQIGMAEDKSGKEDNGPPTTRLVMLAKIYEPRIADAAIKLSNHADSLRRAAFNFYLEVAQAEQPLPLDKFEEKIRPLEEVQKSGGELRSLIERYVQDYI